MDIQNMDDSQNTGQREKEYQHFLFSELQKKTLDIPLFLQMTAIGAGGLCLCYISHQGCAFGGITPIVTT